MRLIDADALKCVIEENIYPLSDAINSRDYGMFWVGIEQAIDEQPTERGTGKWRCCDPVMTEAGLILCTGDYYCSECGFMVIQRSNFCPNCGAKMEEEE